MFFPLGMTGSPHGSSSSFAVGFGLLCGRVRGRVLLGRLVLLLTVVSIVVGVGKFGMKLLRVVW